MKKKFAWIIAVLMILTFPITTAFAEPEPEASQEPAAQEEAAPEATPEPTPEPTATPPETTETKEGAPEVDLSQISSISAMLVDADTGEVLFSKNADWTIFPASTTKLMTAILVMEHCEMDEIVTIPAEVDQFNTASSLMGLRLLVGKDVLVKDLVYGLMMCSGNDAAVALGIHIAGSEEAFVQMMNDKAQELGMTGTHFLNPHGIYIADVGHDHYSTAADMVKLAMEAQKYPFLAEVMSAPSYTYESEALQGTEPVENSNYLLHTPTKKPELAPYLYDKATGMKTGTLERILPPGATEYIKSYGCLVASASDGGLNLIAVIFGDLSVGDKDAGIPNAFARWDIARYLFDYGFTNYAKVDLAQFASPVALTEQIGNVANNDPGEGSLEVKADLTGVASDVQLVDAATVQGLQDGSLKLEEKTNIEEPLQAPITEGQQLGTVTYSLNGQELYTAPLIAGRDVYPQGEESATSKEYGVPIITFELWYLWIILPAAVVLTLLIVRAVNKSRRRSYYAKRGPAVKSKPVQVRTGTVQRKNTGRPGGSRKHRL